MLFVTDLQEFGVDKIRIESVYAGLVKKSWNIGGVSKVYRASESDYGQVAALNVAWSSHWQVLIRVSYYCMSAVVRSVPYGLRYHRAYGMSGVCIRLAMAHC